MTVDLLSQRQAVTAALLQTLSVQNASWLQRSRMTGQGVSILKPCLAAVQEDAAMQADIHRLLETDPAEHSVQVIRVKEGTSSLEVCVLLPCSLACALACSSHTQLLYTCVLTFAGLHVGSAHKHTAICRCGSRCAGTECRSGASRCC